MDIIGITSIKTILLIKYYVSYNDVIINELFKEKIKRNDFLLSECFAPGELGIFGKTFIKTVLYS